MGKSPEWMWLGLRHKMHVELEVSLEVSFKPKIIQMRASFGCYGHGFWEKAVRRWGYYGETKHALSK